MIRVRGYTMPMLRIAAVAALLVLLQLLAACNERKSNAAHVEAMRLLGRPAVCSGDVDNGYVCFDAVGHAAFCPPDKFKPCVVTPSLSSPPCAESLPEAGK